MITVKYVGGLDGVDVILPSGRSVTVMRNEELVCLRNEADALLQSDEWEHIPQRRKTEDDTDTDEGAN